jgi:GntR family transcriptional regulator, transcriptional repressor for pyruvate dehydrogenase complex
VSSLAGREAGLGAQRYVGQVVRAPKTAELIATLYRRQIVRGELHPGDTLPSEQQLMEQFGVSRPTLREAFRILEAEDLISVKRGSRGGARVTQPSLSVAARYVGLLLQVRGTTIADVYEARMVLEPACARLLARRRTKQDLADLTACIDELRGAVEAGQPGTGQPGTVPLTAPEPALWSSRAARFHELIMQRSGSKTLAVQGGVLQDIVATHLALALSRDRARDDELVNFHRNVRSYEKLVALVEERDGPGAEQHWRAHMEAAGQRLLREDLQSRSVVDLFS